MIFRSANELQDKITQIVVLQNISWQTYKSLLADLGEHRSSRLIYDRGILEIKMPSDLHELIKHLLERIVIALTEELNLSIKGFGSVTLDREDLEQGVEPDSCFYIQNADRIQGLNLDITTNPPPDLVIEVDITSSSSRRFNVYKSLQIPEVWRYTKQGLTFYQLQDREYVVCDFSPTFPIISTTVITQFLQQRETADDNTAIRALRKWLQERLESDNHN
jgi:Uma2 family endonuclease